MSTYQAPVNDMQFVLEHLSQIDALRKRPDFADATPDVVEAVLGEAARFAGEVLAPLNVIGDEHGSRVEGKKVVVAPGFDDAYRQFQEAGWLALPFAEAIGGQGLPEVLGLATSEMWQSANMSFALGPMLTQAAAVALEAHGSDSLKDTYLEKLVSGEWSGAMVLTEPQAGSDLAEVRTRAEPDGDAYRLTGQKIFITWGDHECTDNVIHLVLARTPGGPPGIKGLSLFLLPKYLVNGDGSLGQRNDFFPVSVEQKLGIHASPTCVMSYGENGGAVGYLIGAPNSGIELMFTMMNHARIAVGAQGLSIVERAYQQALGYARERVQGRKPGADGRVAIIEHADVRRMLMLMKAASEAMRALCYSTAASLDLLHATDDDATRVKQQARFALLTPVVKAWCTELAQEITSLGIQVHGGMGFIEETGAAQHFRDGRILTIYEGTTGIQANDLVGRKLLRDEGRAMHELINEMRELAQALDGESAKRIKDRLLAGISALEQGSDWLLQHAPQDPDTAGAAAVNYLMLTGTVCGGWQMARAAVAVQSGSGIDARFARNKLATARFYAEHYMPRANAYLAVLQAGSESTMALDAGSF